MGLGDDEFEDMDALDADRSRMQQADQNTMSWGMQADDDELAAL